MLPSIRVVIDLVDKHIALQLLLLLLRLCGFVGPVALWLCGFAALWLCGVAALWLCGFMVLRLRGFMTLRHCDFVASLHCGFLPLLLLFVRDCCYFLCRCCV